MKIASFALKNLSRNKKRTAITVGGTAFAALIMIIWTVLIDGMIYMMRDNITKVEYGELQIHVKDYRNKTELYHTIPNHKALLAELEAVGYKATPRLKTFALAAANDASSGAQLRALDPKIEMGVTEIHKHVKTGKWLDATAPEGAVIGGILAKQLGVGIGDEIVILGQADDGSVANAIVFVRGILKSISTPVDRSAMYINEQTFRDFALLDDGCHEIAIKTPDGIDENLPKHQEAISLIAKDREVETWRQFQPMFSDMLEMMDASMAFMLLIAYFALGLLMVNSSLMSVFERIKELGVMKALGFRPRQVVALILTEITWQTLIASVIAVVLAYPICLYLQAYGIDISAFTGRIAFSGVAMDPHWYGLMSTKAFVIPIVFLFVVIALSSLYPAIKAALINPLKAIYHR